MRNGAIRPYQDGHLFRQASDEAVTVQRRVGGIDEEVVPVADLPDFPPQGEYPERMAERALANAELPDDLPEMGAGVILDELSHFHPSLPPHRILPPVACPAGATTDAAVAN